MILASYREDFALHPLKSVVRTLSLILCCSSLLLAPAIQAQSADQWWFERSDLQLPRQTSAGVLENGLHYVLLPMPNTQHNVAIRMVMGGGILQEQDGQSGSAMFSAAQMLGQLTVTAQAQLDLNQTVVSLHATTQEQISQAFSELSNALRNDALPAQDMLNKSVEQIAVDGRLLAPALSYAQQQQVQRSFDALQSRLSQINGAQAMEFKQRFYAPKNMTLVVVGDFNKRHLEQLIDQQFSDWHKNSATLQSAMVIPSLQAQMQDVAKQNISFNTLVPSPVGNDSKQQRRQTMLVQVANIALQNRINQILQPYNLSAQTQVEWMMNRSLWSNLTIPGVSQEESQKVQQQVKAEIERALSNGFSKAEFELAAATQRAHLQAQTELNQADDIRNQADRLVAAMVQRKVYVTPSSELALFDLFMAHAYEGDLTPALKQSWSNTPTLHVMPSAS
ncbi:peptidase M16 domain-containing protein [Vibrio mimicus SX-4]|uniref:Insulinase family protein n=2 Tax=Vibrio mimicus TaxID=674 RepID=A0A2J9VJY5_VIBMI|nr:peptidase M16 domain-containing protein [Vibrio mimicus SX-4]PNM64091.1 insulinase family protein [Vibrio mimicus]